MLASRVWLLCWVAFGKCRILLVRSIRLSDRNDAECLMALLLAHTAGHGEVDLPDRGNAVGAARVAKPGHRDVEVSAHV